jgi:hypothetical protein
LPSPAYYKLYRILKYILALAETLTEQCENIMARFFFACWCVFCDQNTDRYKTRGAEIVVQKWH